MKSNLLTLLVAAAIALFAVACRNTNRATRWNLSIAKATPATIEVDIIGVHPSEKSAWESYAVDDYFRPNDPRRLAQHDKLTKSDLKAGVPWVIDRKNPVWNDWLKRGATEVVILANLPGSFPPGTGDPRRIFLPLEEAAWNAKDDVLRVELQETLIRVLTPQKRRR